VKKVLILAAFLGGCGGATVQDPRTFDLGLNAPTTSLPVRLGMVRAAAPFDSTDMHYRLSFRNAAEIASFANSRWAATPAEMLRKQILRASGEKAGPCLLELEIQEFTQVFSAREASEARIELRASLSLPARTFARMFTIGEPNAGPDAPNGAVAFGRAADRALAELGRWAGSVADCR